MSGKRLLSRWAILSLRNNFRFFNRCICKSSTSGSFAIARNSLSRARCSPLRSWIRSDTLLPWSSLIYGSHKRWVNTSACGQNTRTAPPHTLERALFCPVGQCYSLSKTLSPIWRQVQIRLTHSLSTVDKITENQHFFVPGIPLVPRNYHCRILTRPIAIPWTHSLPGKNC